MMDDRTKDEAFDSWLRAEALAPPEPPADEWARIQAARAPKSEPVNLWSLTWPSLIAAAIPLAFVLWGGSAGLIAPLLTSATTETPAAQQASADDDQLWLTAGDGQLDVLVSGDSDPLFVD